MVTSPPVRVTPPPEWVKKGFIRTARRTTSPARTTYPLRWSASCGQARAQAPQAAQRSRAMVWPPSPRA